MMSNFKVYSLSYYGRIIALPLELIILATFTTLPLSPFLSTLVTIKYLYFCVEFEALDILRGLGGAIGLPLQGSLPVPWRELPSWPVPLPA